MYILSSKTKQLSLSNLPHERRYEESADDSPRWNPQSMNGCVAVVFVSAEAGLGVHSVDLGGSAGASGDALTFVVDLGGTQAVPNHGYSLG